jgi:hypothetical protein
MSLATLEGARVNFSVTILRVYVCAFASVNLREREHACVCVHTNLHFPLPMKESALEFALIHRSCHTENPNFSSSRHSWLLFLASCTHASTQQSFSQSDRQKHLITQQLHIFCPPRPPLPRSRSLARARSHTLSHHPEIYTSLRHPYNFLHTRLR